jgi:hypothetical protein
MAFSLGASVVAHLVVGVVWSWMMAHAGASAGGLELDQVKTEKPRTRLGIERSDAITITWIGVEEPTPHMAPRSTLDQALQSVGLTGGAAPGRVTPAPAPEERDESRSEATPSKPWRLRLSDMSINVPADRIQNLLEQLVEAGAAAAEVAGGEVSVEGPGGPELPSEPKNADREADAVSRRKPIEVRPGSPAAAEGLRIKTVRPNWTLLLRTSVRAANPVVEITFDPTGKVRLAQFEDRDGRRLNTGNRDVDDVLMNAIYLWTATGEAIDALNAADPAAGVTISMRIILR